MRQALEGDPSGACSFLQGGESMEDKKALASKEKQEALANGQKFNNSKEENLSDIEDLMKHRHYKRRRGALRQISD